MTDYHQSINSLVEAINKASGFLEKIATSKEASTNPEDQFSLAAIGKSLDKNNSENLENILAASPISELLKDDTVSDILINGPFEIYVDQRGELLKTDFKFKDHNELLELADSIAKSLNRRIDPRRPLMDARLPDGSRVNIIAPPMAVDGLSISIRKFSAQDITLDRLEEFGSITPMMKEFLKACAVCKVNVIISGGTGSGKTTLLNAMSQYIPATERIVSIEDSIELRLQQPHVVRLETKSPEVMGDRTREVNIRDLLVNSLRMRPDRIIIGEVRGNEAYDMIQSMNTGHDGSYATIHANNPREAIARVEGMVSQVTSNTPLIVIRKQVVSAVNFIIQVNRQENGKRQVTFISEITGLEGDTPIIHDIFFLKNKGNDEKGQIIYKQEWSGAPPKHAKLSAYVRNLNILKNN
jgi:pilus assembly protein CpaF